MTPSQLIWAVFLRLTTELNTFAQKFTAEGTAATCVRETLAEAFLNAISGIRPPWGVYAGIYAALADSLELASHANLAVTRLPSERDVPLPDPEFVQDLELVYWAVYQAAYLARLSTHEAVALSAMIAESVPECRPESSILEMITLGGRHLEPLRRAFWEVESHECAGDNVCLRAARCREEGLRRHARWEQIITGGEVNSGWRV